MAEKTLKIILQAVVEDAQQKLERIKTFLAGLGSETGAAQTVGETSKKVEELGNAAEATAAKLPAVGDNIEKVGDAAETAGKKAAAAAKAIDSVGDGNAVPAAGSMQELEETAAAACRNLENLSSRLPALSSGVPGVSRAWGGVKKVFGEIRAEFNNTAGAGKKMIEGLIAGGGPVMIILAGIASLVKLAGMAYDEFSGKNALKEQQEQAARLTAELTATHAETEKQRQADAALARQLTELNGVQGLSSGTMETAASAARSLQNRYGDLGISVDKTAGTVRVMGDAVAKLQAAMNKDKARELESEIKSLRNEVSLAREEAAGAGMSFFGLFNIGGEQTALAAAEKQKQLMEQINGKIRERHALLKADPEKDRITAAEKIMAAEERQLEIARLRAAGRKEEAAALADRIELESRSATLTQSQLNWILLYRAQRRRAAAEEAAEEKRRQDEAEKKRQKEEEAKRQAAEVAEAEKRRAAEAEQARKTLASLDEAEWRDAMSDRIRHWQSEMDRFRGKAEKTRAELSRFGIDADGPILKSKKQIKQDQADEALRDKIARQRGGERVRFSASEKRRLAELEKKRQEALSADSAEKAYAGNVRDAQQKMDQRSRDNSRREREAARRDAEQKVRDGGSFPQQQQSRTPPPPKKQQQARPENVERGHSAPANVPGLVRDIRDMLNRRLPGE